ncbi:hypothetical protein TKK_0005179 [Trichogramma kaykai]
MKIELACPDVKTDVNLSVPDKANDWSHRSDQYEDVKISDDFASHSSIQIETEEIVKKRFLSDTQKTIDKNTGCKLNVQNKKSYSLVNKKKRLRKRQL